jgi:thiamine-phosphate pyrophosphorylase
MKLILISDPLNVDNEHGILCSLFENGLEYFHLRKPQFSEKEMEEYLLKIPSDYFSRIVIHSHFYLAEKFAIKGMHVKVPFAGIKENKFSYSASFHSLKEIEACEFKYDYAFLSPVFDSISKQDYRSTLNLTEVSSFLDKNIDKKIIALGGIDENNLSEILNCGFAGVAILGAVWKSKDSLKKFQILKNELMILTEQ